MMDTDFSPSLRAILIGFTIAIAIAIAPAPGRSDDQHIPPSSTSQDTTVLMARNAVDINILKSSLAAASQGGPLTILSWSQPTRGNLTETAGHFTYAPSDAFRIQGSDSFRYRFLTQQGVDTATVFLVADLGPGDADDGSPDGETTAGGDTVLVLDIGDPWTPDPSMPDQGSPFPTSAELLCAQDQDDVVRFKVLLSELPGGERLLQPQAFENGSCEVSCSCGLPCDCDGLVALAPVPLTQGRHTIYLDWWASVRGARNGGLLVRDKDQLVAQRVGLANAFTGGLRWTPDTVSQAIPSVQPAAASSIERSFERSEGIPMAFPPGFADSFEDGTLDAWQLAGLSSENGARPDGLVVSADAATAGSLGLRASLAATGINATMLHPTPDRVARYRARFEVRIDSACVGAAALQGEKETIVLAGIDETSGRRAFELGILVVHGGTFRVTVRALDDLGQWRNFTHPVPISGRAMLDIEWWAASERGRDNGGLALRIDGEERPWPTFALENAAQRLSGAIFGAVGPGLSQPGSICLDELEAWF